MRIFEPRYRRMLEDALGTHRMFCVAMQKPGSKRETPSPVAGLGLVRAAVRKADGTFHLVLQGVSRVLLEPAARYRPYRVHPLVPLACDPDDSPEIGEMRLEVLRLVEDRLRKAPHSAKGLIQSLAQGTGKKPPVEACLDALRAIGHPGQLADLVTLLLIEEPLFRQVILQAHELKDRLGKLAHILQASAPQASGPRTGSDEETDDLSS